MHDRSAVWIVEQTENTFDRNVDVPNVKVDRMDGRMSKCTCDGRGVFVRRSPSGYSAADIRVYGSRYEAV